MTKPQIKCNVNLTWASGEMANTPALGAGARKSLEVQVLSRPQIRSEATIFVEREESSGRAFVRT